MNLFAFVCFMALMAWVAWLCYRILTADIEEPCPKCARRERWGDPLWHIEREEKS